MSIPKVITIDGPAGAGKSTLGELLAKRLDYLYFDTGVMYRALALAALNAQVAPGDADAMTTLAERIVISVDPPSNSDGRQYTVWLDGQDVTWQLRQPEVERIVSLGASHPPVRAIMRMRQRAIGQRGNVVMVGRDIGSIVMPDAQLKIYLEASLGERARRRADELQQRGQAASQEQIETEVKRRDALDRHVMMPAPDAIVLASDDLSPEQEVEMVLQLLQTQNSNIESQPTKATGRES